ncbi:Heterokaryon incompatibility protein 6,OR allele [Lachnellula subtilissima]|uniref:Heterokaryon incompatibility protein 6,OR allele n=1 Tax=Lachnellula subtilissima TaxID=602034 RepID=A0A8H8RD51_9HELO|nr:Heterokaryon incompatibility protein 6,OR allele [Lachnellula subtilissima]
MAKRQSPDTLAFYASLPLAPDSKSIRVLDLDEARDLSDRGELSGQLRVVSLIEKPSYLALSYVWGTFASPENTISCGTDSIKITSNCWSALWHIRKAFGQVTIWVDSICINQDDDEEKASQIPLMGDIYTFADSTYVWLGKANTHSDTVIEYLKVAGFQPYFQEDGDNRYKIPQGVWIRVLIAARIHVKGYYKLLTYYCSRCTSGQVHKPSFITNDGISQDAFTDFFSRDWITRVWTLQEVMLSERLLVLCGTKILPWRSVVYSMAFLDYLLEGTIDEVKTDRDYPRTTSNDWARLVALWLSRNAVETVAERGIPFRHYLGSYLRFLDSILTISALFRTVHLCLFTLLFGAGLLLIGPATKSKLRGGIFGSVGAILSILGLLGIIMWAGHSSTTRIDTQFNLEGVIVEEIRKRRCIQPKDKSFGMHSVLGRLGLPLALPDYSRGLNEVYRELFLSLLKWTASLDPLKYAQYTDNLAKPSWVPDWHSVSASMWSEEDASRTRKTTIPSRPSIPQWVFNIAEPSQLVVPALHVGLVTWRSGTFLRTRDQYNQSDDAAHLYNIQNVQECLKALPEEHHIHYSGREGSEKSAFIWTRTRKYAYVFVDSKRSRDKVPTWIDSAAPGRYESPDRMLEILTSKYSWHIEICNNLETKKRIIFIAGQKIIGNGPEHIQVGDVVAVIYGLSGLMILRPHGNNYRLVGSATANWDDVNSMVDEGGKEFELLTLC